jgi:hypothetical protein
MSDELAEQRALETLKQSARQLRGISRVLKRSAAEGEKALRQPERCPECWGCGCQDCDWFGIAQ